MDKVGKHMTKITTNKEGGKVVTYRGCPVFESYPKQNKVVLDTCGFRTNTTKTRINQAANQFNIPIHVFQKKGMFYVSPTKERKEITDYGSTKGSRQKTTDKGKNNIDTHVVSGLVL